MVKFGREVDRIYALGFDGWHGDSLRLTICSVFDSKALWLRRAFTPAGADLPVLREAALPAL